MFDIICYVATEFRDPVTGALLFAVPPTNKGRILTAPKSIQKDPMYGWLVKDGSLRVIEDKDYAKVANDPMEGVSAEGKSKEAAAISRAATEKAAKEAPAIKNEEDVIEAVEAKKEEEKTPSGKTVVQGMDIPSEEDPTEEATAEEAPVEEKKEKKYTKTTKSK